MVQVHACTSDCASGPMADKRFFSKFFWLLLDRPSRASAGLAPLGDASAATQKLRGWQAQPLRNHEPAFWTRRAAVLHVAEHGLGSGGI